MAMSDAHKEALAKGRKESRAIKRYLEALSSRRPGRPVTAETLTARLAKLEQQIAGATDPLKRVDLVQKRLDTAAALKAAEDSADLDALERGFVDHAAAYSERKGITYPAWREAGGPAAVLKKAGINQTRTR